MRSSHRHHRDAAKCAQPGHHPHRRRCSLGVDPRTVTAGIENGTIPSVKLGRRVLIPREKFLKIFDPEA